MNLVIIDTDCANKFSDAAQINELLGTDDCIVYFLSDDNLRLNEYSLNSIIKKKNIVSCFFLTSLSGGIKKYHTEIIKRNSNYRRWVISVLDVGQESYRKQIFIHFDSLLAETMQLYDIIFDSSDTLANTAAECCVEFGEKRKCLIVSRNGRTRDEAVRIISCYLPSWEVIGCDEDHEQQYRTSDIIIAVGDIKEDFMLPAPSLGINKSYVLINAINFAETDDISEDVYYALAENGWSIDKKTRIFSCSLQSENYYLLLSSNKISKRSLNHDDGFVLWDKYGLPVLSSGYTDEIIDEFFERTLCLEKMISRFRG